MNIKNDICNAVVMDCMSSLNNPYNRQTFDDTEYDDNCHCKENLLYVIECCSKGLYNNRMKRAMEYANIIIRNNQNQPHGCEHIWIDNNIKNAINKMYQNDACTQ